VYNAGKLYIAITTQSGGRSVFYIYSHSIIDSVCLSSTHDIDVPSVKSLYEMPSMTSVRPLFDAPITSLAAMGRPRPVLIQSYNAPVMDLNGCALSYSNL